jgi:hypothetical protein
MGLLVSLVWMRRPCRGRIYTHEVPFQTWKSRQEGNYLLETDFPRSHLRCKKNICPFLRLSK